MLKKKKLCAFNKKKLSLMAIIVGVIVVSWKKIRFVTEVIAGLILQFVFGSVVALPLQGTPDEFSAEAESMIMESILTHDESDELSSSIELKQENNLVFPDAIDVHSAEGELQNLKNSIYFENKKKRDKQHFYSSQNKELNSQSTLNPLDEGKSGLSLLLEPLTNDPELKEKVKDSLASIKDVKDLLTINTEVSFESSEQETNNLIERNLYRQEQQHLLEQRGINNKVSKDKYDLSLFQEFFSKVLTFVLYAGLGIVFIKLMIMFISWQRKINRY